MKKYFLNLVLLGALIATQSCVNDETFENKERVVSVKAELLSLSDETLTRSYTGSLEGEKQAVICSKISEVVEQIIVKEGDKVKKGKVIILLDKKGPTSQYQQAYSLFANSEKNSIKMEYLYKEGAISETQFDAVNTEYEINKASFEAAKQLVEIESPIDGIVTSVHVSEGDFLTPGQKLATVATTNKIRIKFDVKPNEIKYITEGDNVSVFANGGNPLKGKVVSVAKSAEPITRAIQVEAIFNNIDNKLQPGMFARVEIVLNQIEAALIIPRSAIIELDNIPTVYVVVNGKAKRIEIQLGLDLDGKVIVEQGLAPNDTLVTVGQNYLDDDIKVKLIDVAMGE